MTSECRYQKETRIYKMETQRGGQYHRYKLDINMGSSYSHGTEGDALRRE